MSNVIHVGLYGGRCILGGKETPLEADVIRCDHAHNCSFFAGGTCLKVRSFGGGCNLGTIERHRGYTSRAKKYYQFKEKWRTHEKYDKLDFPKKKLGLIDGKVVFLYPYVHFKRADNGQIHLEDPLIGVGNYQFSYEEFTPELISRIVTFRPRAMMGGVIDSYQEETVPLFLAHLEEVLPDRYQEFIRQYPELNIKISYIGRKAKLSTLKPSIVQYKSDRYPEMNEDWYWDGELLHYKGGKVRTPSIVKKFEVVEFVIRPAEDTIITITDDTQVSKDTVFVD